VLRATIISLLLSSFFLLVSCNADTQGTESPNLSHEIEQIGTTEKSQLIIELQNMQAALKSGDEGRMIDALAPQKMRLATGRAMGVSKKDLPKFEKQFIDVTKNVLRQAEFEGLNFDFDRIAHTQTATTAPLALIPTEMVITIEGNKLRSSGQYLGIRRSGEWIILTPSDEDTVKNLKKAFLELRDGTLTPMKMEIVE